MKFALALIGVLFLTTAFCDDFELKTIKKCSTCRGTGKITCPQCRGTRQEPCSVCRGTGYFGEFLGSKSACMCGTGKMDCYNCREFGVFPTGKVTCPDCKGKKFK